MQIVRKSRVIAAGVCAVACAAAIAVPAVAFADDAASIAAEREAKVQTLNNMLAELDSASAKYNEAVAAKEDAQKKIDEAQKNIDKKTEEIADYQGQLGTRARSMYRSGSSSFLDVLFGSTSFDEFATNLDLLNSMNQKDADTVASAKVAKKELENSKRELNEEKARLEESEKIAEEAMASCQAQAEEIQAQIATLDAQAMAMLQASNGGGAGGGGQETVSQGDIVSYDTSTGAATLADGSQATVVGYDGNGNAIVQRAYAALGSRYVWGGVGGSAGGYDCSGLVSYALSGTNNRLGTTGTFIGWNRVNDPQPGDVAVIHNGSSQHTGIYIGNGQMIHAADENTGVVIGNVQDGMVFVRP